MIQQDLTDLECLWGTDLSISNTGDVQGVTGIERGKQRILRRLLTNPGDYIFHPDYGAGLPRYVGADQSKATIDEITGLVTGQILQEACVAKTPAPSITVRQLPDLSLWVYIKYTDQPTGTPAVLDFNVTE